MKLVSIGLPTDRGDDSRSSHSGEKVAGPPAIATTRPGNVFELFSEPHSWKHEDGRSSDPLCARCTRRAMDVALTSSIFLRRCQWARRKQGNVLPHPPTSRIPRSRVDCTKRRFFHQDKRPCRQVLEAFFFGPRAPRERALIKGDGGLARSARVHSSYPET